MNGPPVGPVTVTPLEPIAARAPRAAWTAPAVEPAAMVAVVASAGGVGLTSAIIVSGVPLTATGSCWYGAPGAVAGADVNGIVRVNEPDPGVTTWVSTTPSLVWVLFAPFGSKPGPPS